jgi:hypothetical protein
MTNYPSELQIEIDKFNSVNNTDLRLVKILNEEVNFVELETSMSNELLFTFGVQFGQNDEKKSIEGRI